MADNGNGAREHLWRGGEAYRWITVFAMAVAGVVATRLLSQLDTAIAMSQQAVTMSQVLQGKVASLEQTGDELRKKMGGLEITIIGLTHSVDDHTRRVDEMNDTMRGLQMTIEQQPRAVPNLGPEQRARQKWQTK